jgi:nucleotide-binding universal stress UspA family protein
MSYKTILIHLNDEHRAPGLLRAALSIARPSGGHVKGLSVMPPVIIIPDIEGGAGAVIDDHREAYRGQVARLKTLFERATAEMPEVSREWTALDCENENPFGIPASVVVAEARSADLVIASQDNPDWALTGHLDVAEQIVMESGRPVLVMPKTERAGPLGERILVAWNNSRESARAAFDALPLLRTAKEVRVLWVNPEASKRTAGDLPGFDLCAALARHGVHCEAAGVPASDARAGHALLDAADGFKADMLVMGCYGHSRLREMILGGASNHILHHAPMPVLMAH